MQGAASIQGATSVQRAGSALGATSAQVAGSSTTGVSISGSSLEMPGEWRAL